MWIQDYELHWMNTLVAECSDTLKSINVFMSFTDPPVWLFNFFVETDTLLPFAGVSMRSSIDLSKATRLRVARFDSAHMDTMWIVTALQTITSRHGDLRQIVIDIYDPTFRDPGTDIRQMVGEAVYGEWLDLDRLLVQFWELRSIRLKIVYIMTSEDIEEAVDCVLCLLPEMTRSGGIDLNVL